MTLTTIGLRYGLVLAAGLIAYGILFRVLNIPYSSPLTWIFYLMLPVGGWLAVRALASAADAPPSLLRFAGFIALVMATGAGLYSGFVFVYNRFIDDSLLVAVRSDRVSRLHAGGLSGDELASSLARVELASTPAVFSLNVFIALFVFGVLSSLVVALLVSRLGPAS